MEIKIYIEAPDLSHAINMLAIAIGTTVDKIGVGEAIKEAVDQGPAKVTKEDKKVTKQAEKVTKEPETTPDQEMIEDVDPPFEPPVITIEEVREAFMAKNSKSNTTKLKAILKNHGVAKVTDLPEDSFPEVLKELEDL